MGALMLATPWSVPFCSSERRRSGSAAVEERSGACRQSAIAKLLVAEWNDRTACQGREKQRSKQYNIVELLSISASSMCRSIGVKM